MDDSIYNSIYKKSYELDPLATSDVNPCVRRPYSNDMKENYEKKYAVESKVATRTQFQRDKDRIIYSKAFRRLIHKTQVCFMGEMREHIRTRLTHTLEVSQIARTIARQVRANEDLVEAIALGHDLGHTPFGHTGEEVLNDFLTGEDKGIREKLYEMYGFKIEEMGLCFKHNFQSVRVLNELEEGYYFKGLNITYPVLEGILKHTSTRFKEGKREGEPVVYDGINEIEEFHIKQSFSCSLEGQIVDLADEIAQVCHDIEDAIEGNYDSKEIICAQLQDLTDKFNISCLERDVNVKEEIATHHIKYIMSCLIGKLISDAVLIIKDNMLELNGRRQKAKYPLNEDIATHKRVLEHNALYKKLKEIEDTFVINNYMIDKMNYKSKFVLRQIIKAYITNPKQLPDHVFESYTKVCSIPTLYEKIRPIDSVPANIWVSKNIRYLSKDDFKKHKSSIIKDKVFLRLMSDYIASMTDFYALQQYQKLYGGDSI